MTEKKTKLTTQDEVIKQVMSYGLKMRRESKQGITPAYHRPPANRIEFITAIMYQNNKHFCKAIESVYETLRYLNPDNQQKLIYREINKVSCAFMQHPDLRNREKNDDNPWKREYITLERKTFRFEILRRESFANWPVKEISPKLLAAEGFYYTQQRDTVRCFSCSVEISGWGKGGKKNPRAEHHRWSQMCTFLGGLPSSNIAVCQEVYWRRPINVNLTLTTGIHGLHRYTTGTAYANIDMDNPAYLQPGFTFIWNLEFEFSKKGFGNKITFGECATCNKPLPVWRGCQLCGSLRFTNNNIYTISTVCPLPNHQRELLMRVVCFSCKRDTCPSSEYDRYRSNNPRKKKRNHDFE